MAGMATKAVKKEFVVLVSLKVEADTQKEAKAFVKENLANSSWDDRGRIKKIRIAAIPKPRKCRHKNTEEIEREDLDWLKGKSWHWRETICRDCGATVRVSDGWYE